MHDFAIPPSVTERVIARRGRAHIYDDLDPGKTALIVVDMQNAFMLPGVAHTLCPMAQAIVPNVNRLARAVHESGGTVIFIKTSFTEDTRASWSVYYGLSRPEQNERRAAALAPGSKGHQLWAGLEARADDLVIEKRRFSAFIQGSSDLESVLRERGLDTLLVTGTVTGVCCESTARDAMMLNFKTIMVTDGNAAMSDEEHAASLIQFYLTFGDIMSTDMLVECLGRNARRDLAAAE